MANAAAASSAFQGLPVRLVDNGDGTYSVAVTTLASGLSTTAITTATTTLVKSGAGVVGSISNAGSATTGTITVYDSLTASGKKLWSGTVALGGVVALGMPCAIGITVVTAAADTIAVSYA